MIYKTPKSQKESGAEPLVGGSGRRSPTETETVASGRSMKAAKLHIFLKFGNAENHRYLRCFAKK